MKVSLHKIFFLLIFMWFLSFNAESQYSCGFDKMHQERMQKDTVYKDKFLQNQKETEIFLENYRNQNQRIIPFSTGINVTFIPIAVHVIHLGEAIGVGSNLSDEVINNAFRVTNENYINSNGVGNTIIPIQFEIKSIDRYDGSAFPKYDSLGISFGANDYNETLIKTATRISNVYNVWIVSEVENGMWGGYAYFPQNDPNFSLDGSVVLAQLMYSYYIQQRNTVSHELGHALNLYHTFYNYTNCNANGFLDNDFCPDTPPHQQTECGTVNSCDSPLENSSKNYMSYCGNLNPLYIFTPYQNSRTVAALNSASRSYKKMYNYALSQNSSDFLKIKDSVNITLTTSETAAPWTISNIPFWVILDKTSGKGSAVIKCVVLANSTSLQRVAKLNLNGIIYTITQAANLNINSTANFGGVISPLGNVSVSQGDDIQFTITPNKGYYLETLLVNNNIIENTTLYTFSNIQANQSIRAVFTKYPYFVATVFNSGGTISPSDTSFVFINSTRTFTITPNFGYKLDSLFIDGNPIVNTNIYTFEHINTNHTIQAKFVFDSNNLKLLINNSYGGTLSATGLISVTKKSNYSIIITPDFGYQIDSIFINNKYIVFDANVYTFYNITASYIFYVKFKRIPVNISPDNFYIETKDLSCLNVKNGTLTILSKNNNYLFNFEVTATNGFNDRFIYQIGNKTTKIYSALDSGTYAIKITVPGYIYQLIYTVTINQPKKLVVSSQFYDKQLNLNFNGSEKYFIHFNNEVTETKEQNVILSLKPGLNIISVSTSKECQGIYNDTFLVSNDFILFPNPAQDFTNIYVGGNDHQFLFSIYSENGVLLDQSEMNLLTDRIIKVNLQNYQPGIYLIKLNSTHSKGILKLIKK